MFNLLPKSASKPMPSAANAVPRRRTQARTSLAAQSAALLALAVTLLASAAAQAGPHPVRSPFHVGQKVEFDWGGKTIQGEVVAIDRLSGWVDVRYEENGQKQTMKRPPTWVRAVKKETPGKAAGAKKEQGGEKPEAELREWTDVTGTHKIKGRFVKLADGKVTLEKEDGGSVHIQVTKLCEADQKLAAKLAGSASDDPFVADKPSGGEEEPDKASSADSGDWSRVRSVQINLSAENAIHADAAAWEKMSPPRPILLPTPNQDAERNYFFESLSGMFLNRSRQLLIVASLNQAPGKHLGARLAACDLTTAKSLGAEDPGHAEDAVRPLARRDLRRLRAGLDHGARRHSPGSRGLAACQGRFARQTLDRRQAGKRA